MIIINVLYDITDKYTDGRSMVGLDDQAVAGKEVEAQGQGVLQKAQDDAINKAEDNGDGLILADICGSECHLKAEDISPEDSGEVDSGGNDGDCDSNHFCGNYIMTNNSENGKGEGESSDLIGPSARTADVGATSLVEFRSGRTPRIAFIKAKKLNTRNAKLGFRKCPKRKQSNVTEDAVVSSLTQTKKPKIGPLENIGIKHTLTDPSDNQPSEEEDGHSHDKTGDVVVISVEEPKKRGVGRPKKLALDVRISHSSDIQPSEDSGNTEVGSDHATLQSSCGDIRTSGSSSSTANDDYLLSEDVALDFDNLQGDEFDRAEIRGERCVNSKWTLWGDNGHPQAEDDDSDAEEMEGDNESLEGENDHLDAVHDVSDVVRETWKITSCPICQFRRNLCRDCIQSSHFNKERLRAGVSVCTHVEIPKYFIDDVRTDADGFLAGENDPRPRDDDSESDKESFYSYHSESEDGGNGDCDVVGENISIPVVDEVLSGDQNVDSYDSDEVINVIRKRGDKSENDKKSVHMSTDFDGLNESEGGSSSASGSGNSSSSIISVSTSCDIGSSTSGVVGLSESKLNALAREETIRNSFAGAGMSDEMIMNASYDIEAHFAPLSRYEDKAVDDNYNLIKAFKKGNYDILEDAEKRRIESHTLTDVLSQKYNTPLSRQDIARVIDNLWLNDNVSFMMSDVTIMS